MCVQTIKVTRIIVLPFMCVADDFEEIKQDISSFRYEMLNVLKSREQQLVELNRSLSQFKRSMSTGTMSGLY
ncbi:hypothetical protein DPMN_178157 [Dreissena polymorpha]|uniref:Uncharacterized protein n=1 Tax=Dreissena polymorpha TaxID=45954 RepID=A0A9D4EA28_DREPO|nr:hypothetical protein DPMN_178157 [Dreissena polymorpha]